MIYRQGDVLLRKIEEIPKEAKKRKEKNNILVKGEATGHSHRLVNGQIYELESFREEPALYIEAGKQTILVHDEHKPIEIESGFYILVRQREYNGETNSLVYD